MLRPVVEAPRRKVRPGCHFQPGLLLLPSQMNLAWAPSLEREGGKEGGQEDRALDSDGRHRNVKKASEKQANVKQATAKEARGARMVQWCSDEVVELKRRWSIFTIYDCHFKLSQCMEHK